MPYNDIFIDNDTVKNLANPVGAAYKQFISWLIKEGSLVVSNKIINEYCAGCGGQKSANILTIIDIQTKAGRLNKKSNADLKLVRFPQRLERAFRSNRKDWDHIRLVLLSDRRFAISQDANFCYDLTHYPSGHVTVAKSPAQICYV